MVLTMPSGISVSLFVLLIISTLLLNNFLNNIIVIEDNECQHRICSLELNLSIGNLTNLENAYCRSGLFCSLPLTNESIFGNERTLDINKDYFCSSIYHLFILLRNGCSDSNVDIVRKDIAQTDNDLHKSAGSSDEIYKDKRSDDIGREDVSSDDEEENGNNIKENTIGTSLAYVLLCLLLLLSMTISIVEFCRERKRKVIEDANDTNNGTASETFGGGGGRRMSIVDLTVIRHARKESQQRDSITGLNSGPARVPPPLIRRSSFPAQIPEVVRGRSHAVPRQQTWSPQSASSNSRRVSIDYTEDDSSPDRRRVRIIRRH